MDSSPVEGTTVTGSGGGGWLSRRRVALAIAAAVALTVAFVTASYLTDPGSGPSSAERDVKEAEAAVRADPNDPAARLSLASAYLRADRSEDALGQFQEALVIEPENEEALLGAGVSQLELGRLEGAVEAFGAIVALNQDNPYAEVNQRLETAHYYLGRVYREQGRLDESINELRLALKINRSDADVLFELGQSFHASGQYEDAVSAYEVALAFVPDFVEAYEGLRESAQAGGDAPKAGYAEAMVLALDGGLTDAASRLEEISAGSQDSRIWWGLGYVREELGDVEGARAAYAQAVEINPGERIAADALARLADAE